jgi:hypothetical protein
MLCRPDPESLSSRAREFLQNGLAIEPVLVKDQGEMTSIILKHEQVLIACSTLRFVKELCKILFLDFKSLQHFVRERLYKRQLLPIPLTFQFVLLPLRTYQQGVKTRGFLWIAHRHIKEITPSKNNRSITILRLTNGHTCLVPYSMHFIYDQIRDAALIDYMFREAHLLFPHDQRPSSLGQALGEVTLPSLHHQLMSVAEAVRRYPI